MFKIAHVSDLHMAVTPHQKNAYDYVKTCVARRKFPAGGLNARQITARQGSHCPFIARAAAKFLSKNLLDHEVLIISGDLATTGLDDDLHRAARYISDSPSPIRQYLSASGLPTLASRSKIMLMPGNHDRFQNRDCLSGGTNFENHFDNYWPKPTTRIRVNRLVHRKTGVKLFLVFVDFCLLSNDDAFPVAMPFYGGQGSVNPGILSSLETATAYLRKEFPDDGIIWVSHFPPTGALAGLLPWLTLNGHLDLIAAANRHNIEFIISGHVHDPIVYNEANVKIICAGALCTFFEEKGNWIHSLEFGVKNGAVNLLSHQGFSYNEQRDVFI